MPMTWLTGRLATLATRNCGPKSRPQVPAARRDRQRMRITTPRRNALLPGRYQRETPAHRTLERAQPHRDCALSISDQNVGDLSTLSSKPDLLGHLHLGQQARRQLIVGLELQRL